MAQLKARVEAINKTHNSNYVSVNGHVRNLLSWQNQAKAQLSQLNSIKNDVNAIKSWKNNHDSWAGNQAKRISSLEGWRTTQASTSVKHGGRIGALESWRKTHDAWAKKLSEKGDANTSSINGLFSWKEAHDEWAGKQAQKLTELERRVGDLSVDFSDAAIIASINFQGKANTDLWNADNYDGGSINEKDGKAVRLFKVQFQGLKSHISSMLKTYFGKEGIYTEIMLKPLNRITDLLELIKDKEVKVDIPDLTDNFTRLMTLLNTLLGLIKENHHVIQDLGLKEPLNRMIELLEAIRDKKIIVEVPPIEIPEIKVPEVTLSEKGNDWLKTLIKTVGGIVETAIKTMGEVLGKAIDGVSENLGKLIDLVSGLLDDVIKLIVPENLDFMNKRFDGFQKKIKVKFNFLFSGIDGFKGLFSNQKKIEDIDFSLGVFGNNESVSIPLSWINKFAPYVRPIITGFIALEFLIDMYKWFHMRGEVVE